MKSDSNIQQAIETLRRATPNPSAGLLEEVFQFVSEITPLVNVDLLIKNELGQSLLSYRNDEHCGVGWHLPGGVVRVKEKFELRLKQVALREIGTELEYDPQPLAVNQLIASEKSVRCHCVSILYKCFLPVSFPINNKGLHESSPGFLKWFDESPKDLLVYHEVYRKYL